MYVYILYIYIYIYTYLQHDLLIFWDVQSDPKNLAFQCCFFFFSGALRASWCPPFRPTWTSWGTLRACWRGFCWLSSWLICRRSTNLHGITRPNSRPLGLKWRWSPKTGEWGVDPEWTEWRPSKKKKGVPRDRPNQCLARICSNCPVAMLNELLK